MKTIVVYQSKYGYTQTYAQWIQQALGCQMARGTDCAPADLVQYDTIIYGGGLYAVGINGIRLLTDSFEALQGKNLVVWATGSCPGRPEELEQVWARNFTAEQRRRIKTFYLRGGFDYTRLQGGDKALMNLLKVKLRLTKHRTADENGLLEAYAMPENHCEKANIEPLVQYVKGLASAAADR